jgi:hypothetical protein
MTRDWVAWRLRTRAAVALVLIALLGPGAARAGPGEDRARAGQARSGSVEHRPRAPAPRPGSGELPARALLARAFARTFEPPGVRRVELRVERDGRTVARRRFEVAHRRARGTARTLLRFTAPDYLRGHALLLVEGGGGRSDTWLYQPEERRPRRVAMTQKGDSFYGSDLCFEDLEHPRWERWHVTFADEAAPPLRVLEAVPPPDSQYRLLRAWVDVARAAVVQIDFFRGTGRAPVKRLRAELADGAEEHGYLHLRRLRIEQVGREASTELVLVRLRIDPELAPGVFSATRLEREGEDLFDLAARHAAAREAP